MELIVVRYILQSLLIQDHDSQAQQHITANTVNTENFDDNFSLKLFF